MAVHQFGGPLWHLTRSGPLGTGMPLAFHAQVPYDQRFPLRGVLGKSGGGS